MQTIQDWLSQLGLGKYADAFVQNDVDLRALPYVREADLQELGVSLGHRKIILAAISKSTQSHLDQPVAVSVERQVADSVTTEISQGTTADRRLLSVLFCDLVGSTELSAQLDPEDMHELTRRYQDTIAGSITRFGGYVAKYLGDGVLSYFGWPMAYEDHAERAIRAGLDAIGAVNTMQAPGDEQLKVRIGIATGHVVVGDIPGGSANERGSIAGDTPNLAARLQTAAAPGQILVADSTRRLPEQMFEIEALGDRELKGFKTPIPVFAIHRDRKVDSRFAARAGGLSKFVGRTSELGILLERWELAKANQGQVILVSGEAGMGKSRLVDAFEECLHGGKHELIRLQCSPYHATSAFYPIVERLSRLAGFSPSDDARTRVEKLQAILRPYGENPHEVGPVYTELLSLEVGDQFMRLDLPAQQQKDLIIRTLANRLLLATKIAPVLFVVEDAHWIDPSTAEVLKEVVSRIHSSSILVIVTHRPEWSASWAAESSQVMSLALGRLTKAQMRELIESMFEDVPDQLAERIADRTDGVPLFVEELTRSIQESGKSAIDVEIPDSLQGSLMARLDHLSPTAKEVAQIASVIGREFDRRLLSKVARVEHDSLDAALDELMSTQLVVIGGVLKDALIFRHALIQDTAYQSLLSRRRRQYHEEIAGVLIDEHPDLVLTQPELIAQHFDKALQKELAYPYWMKAGERALARSANYEAVDHFRNALSIAECISEEPIRKKEVLAATFHLGEALNASGRLADALGRYKVAAELARDMKDTETFVRCALGFDLAQFLSAKPLGKSLELLKEAMEGIGSHDQRLRCSLLSRLARAYSYLGDSKNSARCRKEGTKLAQQLGDKIALFDLNVLPLISPWISGSTALATSRIVQVDDLKRLAAETKDDDARGRAMSLDVYISLEQGERARTNQRCRLEELGTLRERMDVLWLARHPRAMLAILDGNFLLTRGAARQRSCRNRRADTRRRG